MGRGLWPTGGDGRIRVLRKFQPLCSIPGLIVIRCSPLCCSLSKSDTIGSTTYDPRFRSQPPCLLLASYLKNSSLALNLTDQAAFCVPNLSSLGALMFDFSFTISFNVSIYQQMSNNMSKARSSVILAIHPEADFAPTHPICRQYAINSNYPSYPRPRPSYPSADSKVSVQISRPVDGTTVLIWLQIDMDTLPHNSASTSVENNYGVTIRYHLNGLMVVDVSGDGMRESVNATSIIQVGGHQRISTSIVHFSSLGQLLNLDNWNMKITEYRYGGSSDTSSDSQGSSLTAILCSVLGSAAAIAIMATAVYLYFNSKYRRWMNEQERLSKIMQGLPGVPAKVDFADIKRATKNFHESMKLGKGGFGAVYRCTIPASPSGTGQAVEMAVKKFMQEVEDRRYDDFLAEVSIINRLRHKNIVPLVGWSYNKGVPLLVYEYMTNGSLDQHLFRGGVTNKHHDSDAAIWRWDTRYGIVRDIATGLHYVHHEHEPMVLHRDIKASNIMLDSAFRARLGDFGIACTVAANKSYVTGIAGTFGYIAPDYAMSHKATRQTDIYAFGVLVLEVVTGKKNGDVQPDDDHITEWVWRLHRQGMLLEAVDKNMQDDVIFIDEAKHLLLLGLACTNPNPTNRPSIADVVQVINKLAPAPEVPLERPTFMWPPEDWRTRNSVHSTAISDLDKSSGMTSTIELTQFNQELPPSASTGDQTSIHSKAESDSRTGDNVWLSPKV